LFASVVEAEDLIAQVQSRDDKLNASVEAIASLNVELGVRVQILVAGGPFESEDRIARRPGAWAPLIGIDVRIVMTDGEAGGKGFPCRK
jgi:hypothetical protein